MINSHLRKIMFPDNDSTVETVCVYLLASGLLLDGEIQLKDAEVEPVNLSTPRYVNCVYE